MAPYALGGTLLWPAEAATPTAGESLAQISAVFAADAASSVVPLFQCGPMPGAAFH